MRVVEHSSALGNWTMAFATPDARLGAVVERYVGYRESATAFTSRREMPITSVVLIINLGAPIQIIDTLGDRLEFRAGQGFCGGLSDSYAISETSGAQEGVQVFFTPLGARRFFARPLSELTNRVLRLEDLLGTEAPLWAERLQAAGNWRARFELLDAAILARVHASAEQSEIAWAWRQLAASQGRIAVTQLTTELAWSRKHLAARFHDQIGLPPKLVARLFRFQQALRLLEGSGAVDWSGIAFDAGYYDQAHLIRDFRQFSGRSPSEFLQHRLPDNGGITG
jgi:AraC-like DNA-binding protein